MVPEEQPGEDKNEVPPSEVWERLSPEQRARVIKILAKIVGKNISTRPESFDKTDDNIDVIRKDQPDKPAV
jgi:hypothetical protein